MDVIATAFAGLVELRPVPRPDARGRLLKTFESSVFAEAGLPVAFAEEMHTFSRNGVVRGMHFQTPPCEQGKTVECHHGAIFDVVVDLRAGSPTYGQVATFELRDDLGNGLYIPGGFAHGFCVTGESAVVAYRLTAPWAPANEAGIRWDSVGVEWPVSDPIVSERDAAFPALADYASPFVFRPL